MSISVQNISKSFKNVSAIQNISFEVKSGELFGLIGPDGAGKTTLFRTLTTLLIPNEGNAIVAGHDIIKNVKEIRNSVGYMPGKFSLYKDLTIAEKLAFIATIVETTIEENYDLIEDIYVQIEPFKNRRAGALSGGMKQKLALCCALIHKPEVLFLDEPTTGVDPVSRKEFWEMLKRLKQKGITILVSTPYMDEAVLCDRIALIQKGEILKIDTPENIVSSYKKTIYDIKTNKMHQLIEHLKKFPTQYSVFAFGEYVHYIDNNIELDLQKLKIYLEEKQHTNIIIQKATTTIEDVFMDL